MSISNDLLGAFEQRKVGKFQEALEVYGADPNFLIKTVDKTVFEIILGTPNSSIFIKLCIENGADFYMVNRMKLSAIEILPIVFSFLEKHQRTVSSTLCNRFTLFGQSQASEKSVSQYRRFVPP